MTNNEKQEVIRMREQGLGYGAIASRLNISKSTISTFCKEMENGSTFCLECGKKLVQVPKHKKRKYCSDKCRRSYLRKNGNNNQNLTFETECECCHKKFKSFKSLNRKYCSWDCYKKGRYGGKNHE